MLEPELEPALETEKAGAHYTGALIKKGIFSGAKIGDADAGENSRKVEFDRVEAITGINTL